MLAAAAALSASAHAQQRVQMNLIDAKGVGAPIGTIEITAGPSNSTIFTPNLKGLPPGTHGFHMHEVANCGAKEKDGKPSAGEMAGAHWDPQKTKVHGGATGNGHMGDLPPITADAQGNAKTGVVAPRLAIKDVKNKSLVIHAGGDNASDRPQPNGGGGERIACGVIAAK
jgi:Cu-Zn family superoxide dismutase